MSELPAAWVLACDGARSTIREALGIGLVGTSSPSRWLVVDTDAPGESGSGSFVPGDFEFGADPAGPWVHGPLPGGAHRWEFLLPGSARVGGREDPAVVVGLLERRLGGPAPVVRRAAVYAFHARVATRLRVGRVLLLGDAAHLSPPFAGQGLCAGLRDAGNVAWKVAAAWHGDAGEALLESYAVERRPHVLRTTALAFALGTVVELRRPRAATLRDAALRRVAETPAVRRWIARGGWRPPATLRRGLVADAAGHRWRAGEPLVQPFVRADAGIRLKSPTRPHTAVRPDATARPDTSALPDAGTRPDTRTGAGPGDRDPTPSLLLDDALPRGWVLLGTADPGPVGRSLGVTAIPFADLGDGGAVAHSIAPAALALVRPDRVLFGTAPAGAAGALLAELAATGCVRPTSPGRAPSS